MEMTYDGTLVMPSSYAVMDEDEMMYCDGGIYFSNSQVRRGVFAFISAYTINPILVAGAVSKFAGVVARVAAKMLGWIGSVFGGFIGGAIGHIMGAWTGWSIAFAVGKALVCNEGIDVSWGGISAR